MAKYSLTFKLKVVTAYLNSEGGYSSLAKKYGVKDATQVLRWLMHLKDLVKMVCVEGEIIQDTLQNLN